MQLLAMRKSMTYEVRIDKWPDMPRSPNAPRAAIYICDSQIPRQHDCNKNINAPTRQTCPRARTFSDATKNSWMPYLATEYAPPQTSILITTGNKIEGMQKNL